MDRGDKKARYDADGLLRAARPTGGRFAPKNAGAVGRCESLAHMSRTSAYAFAFAGFVLVAAGAWTAPLSAQIPEKYTNLRVLPKDITRPQLVAIMRDFAIQLGVRCHHCHVGEEGADFSTFDFATDVKAAKATARKMMALTGEINTSLTSALGSPADNQRRVTCFTCHRGTVKPLTAPPSGRGGAPRLASSHTPVR